MLSSIYTAFLEGFLLAISPCVLSILPIILSSSIDQGKQRPLGIILGLMSSFCLFSLFLGKLILSLGLNPEVIRLIAVCMIILFACTMIFSFWEERFQNMSTQVSNWGNRLQSFFRVESKKGMLGGLLLGICLGLIWTPCVGPLIGGAIAQASSQISLLKNMGIIVAFCLGAAIPMFLIAFYSHKLVHQINFLKTHATLLRRIGGSLILLTVVLNSGSTFLFAKNWVQSNIMGVAPSGQASFSYTKVGCKL